MLVLALVLSAGLVPQTPEIEFRTVHEAQPPHAIQFVRFVSGPDGLALGIYGKRGLMTVWPDKAAVQFAALRLASDQAYVLDSRHSALAVRTLHYPCLDLATSSLLADLTQLEFPDGFPWFDPELPPPKPAPPPPVQGARSVHVSSDARLLIFVEERAELGLQRDVQVFVRPQADSAGFELAGTYTNHGWGDVRTSAGGRRFAQREGSSVRVFEPANLEQPVAKLPLAGPFDLSADGAWLARALPDRVALDALPPFVEEADGAERRSQELGLGARPLGVHFSGGWLVVRSAEGVRIFDPGLGVTRWSRAAQSGSITSADVLPLSGERALVAVASLEIVRPPMRRSGAFVEGRAIASIEVVDTLDDRLVARDRFEISRWDRGLPEVSLTPSPTRAIVTVPERVRISEEIPGS